jgi:hypothetical protein
MLTNLLAAVLVSTSLIAPAPAADPVLKDQVRGLVDRTGPARKAFADTVDAFVIRVEWAKIQPTKGGPLDLTEITTVLRSTLAQGKSVRLRVTAGVEAPQWAKELDGEPLPWFSDNKPAGTIGAFWTERFRLAYNDLQEKLKAAYDGDARIREVVVARCTTEFVEPYVRQAESLAENAASLKSGGYTLELDKACHREEIDAHKIWEHTRSYLAFNPYQALDQDTKGKWFAKVDPEFTNDMIDYCRTSLGSACVLGNNSLDADRPQTYLDMYQHMKDAGGPIAFQTATAPKVCNMQDPCPDGLWNDTLDLALQYGASAVELPDGQTGYTSWSFPGNPGFKGLDYYDAELTRR